MLFAFEYDITFLIRYTLMLLLLKNIFTALKKKSVLSQMRVLGKKFVKSLVLVLSFKKHTRVL